MPDRTDGVDDVPGRQTKTGRDLRVAGGAAAEEPARREKLRAGGAVDRTVDTTAAQKRRIGRVNDGVDRELRDVALDHFEARHLPRPSLTTIANSLFVTG